MAFRWRADDGSAAYPSSTKKKIVVKVGPPLTKLSGSAHAVDLQIFKYSNNAHFAT